MVACTFSLAIVFAIATLLWFPNLCESLKCNHCNKVGQDGVCMDSADSGTSTDCEDKPSKTTTCATVTPKDTNGVSYAAKTCLYWSECELKELGLITDGTCKTIEKQMIESATAKCPASLRAADGTEEQDGRRGETGRQVFTSKSNEYCLCTKDYCNGGNTNGGESQKRAATGSGGLMMMISFLTTYLMAKTTMAQNYPNYL